jgi:hypothetical protein
MIRLSAPILVALFVAAGVSPAEAQGPAPTLVLPLRSVGVSETTLVVCHALLAGDLEDLSLRVMRGTAVTTPLPQGSDACDDPECAALLGRQHQAGQVVYGSLTRLGKKIIARISVLRAGEAVPYYRDQLTATTEADLDGVMRRFAEGIAAGRPNSDRATVDSVTRDEAFKPLRRATRSGLGFRAGFVYPDGSSYGGTGRLTNFRFTYKFETHSFLIETTSLLGSTFGEGQQDWTILDLSACRIFGTGDLATYLGAGVGVHTVHIEKEVVQRYEYPDTYEVLETREQSETAPSVDLVAGLLAFRTYDFEIIVEARYHHIFEDFEKVDGKGAHGFLLTFGTSR